MLLNFENQAKTYKWWEKQLFADIKKAFTDYKKEKWYNSLDDNTKNQLSFIENILSISNNYNEYEKNIEVAENELIQKIINN